MKHIFLALALLFSARLVRSASLGAVVQDWHYDAATNRIMLKIVNTSHKDITAWNVSIKETYENGHVSQHETLEELLGNIILYGEAEGAFHPGEVRDQKQFAQPGMVLTDYQAVVDVVAYADGTAESTNSDALGQIIKERQAAVTAQKMATEIIKTALADQSDSNPSTTAVTKIEQRVNDWNKQEHRGNKWDLDTVTLQSIANELKQTPGKEDAQKIVTKEEAKTALLSAHATLKAGSPQ